MAQVGSSTFTIPTTGTRRAIYIVDISRGSPNYSLAAYFVPAASIATDFTEANLSYALEQPGAAPIVAGVTLSANGFQSVAADESTGAFDTADFSWNNTSFALEVSAVSVYRYA